MTVIGIAGDLRDQGLGTEPDAEVFWPYRQLGPTNLWLVVRTSADATQFSPELQPLCRALAASYLPAYRASRS